MFKEQVAAAVPHDLALKGKAPKANAREQYRAVVELVEAVALRLITRNRIKIS